MGTIYSRTFKKDIIFATAVDLNHGSLTLSSMGDVPYL